MATPFTATQLNAWMHEHHADTVAYLAQRGLAMEFMDAKPGRPTVLRISSAKASFVFHLPVPKSLQYLADMAPMMESARGAAPGFRKVFHFNDARANSLDRMVTVAKYGNMLYTDPRGWQLQFFPDERWVDGFRPRTTEVSFSIDDLFINWVEEVKTLDYMRTVLEVPAIINDASKSIIMPVDSQISNRVGTASLLSIATIGKEQSKYTLYLFALKTFFGDFRIGCKIIIDPVNKIVLPRKLFIQDSSFFWISSRHEYPFFNFTGVFDKQEKPILHSWEPEVFGISQETLALMVELKIPIAHELPRFKQVATESYAMDFTMTERATDSGLSL